MTRSITASAPGKLMMFGEYAVLEGAPALVCAVNRRCRVTIRSGVATGSFRSPQLHPDPISYGYEDDAVRWSCPDELKPQLALARHLLEAGEPVPLEVTVSTAAFQHRGRKLGLGSSAAMTVAWCRAADAGLESAAELRDRAERIHQAFQRGRGSGADIVASAYGGLLMHRRGAAPRRLTWPGKLGWQLVWTGESADTRDFLRRLGEWQQAEPARYAACFDRLTNLAE
ncbi:MAG: hypothetical protein R3200_06640, partial [Xanthomonadales bacterium]|nr:hypothetical protein [Xanthomonadales bacterium]